MPIYRVERLQPREIRLFSASPPECARECCIVSALARAEAGGDRSYALRQSTITVYSRHHCRSSQP
jgi:hypothetical protein